MEATPLGMRPAARMRESEMKMTAEMSASLITRGDASVSGYADVPVTEQKSISLPREYRKVSVD